MLTCREVARAVAADELESATLRRRLAVRFHLLMCTRCRRYAEQIRALGDTARQMFGDEGERDRERIDRLRAGILDRCRGGDDER